MTDIQQKAAVKEFIKHWTGRGDEKQDTQSFWLAFLRDVFGVEKPEDIIKFEVPVKLGHTSFIDAYIESTHVLIEQKGREIDLKKGYKQSDGAMMTPFQQARRYAGNLPHNMNPRWIIVCNFREFHIHDMNRPNDPAEVIALDDLEREIHRFRFLLDTGSELLRREMEISLQAGELVGKLYDALLKQYNSPASDEELKSLNMLCVRLVFCLYAEDAGIFGSHTMFHDYLKGFNSKNVRKALIDLFRVLDTKIEARDPYMDEDLAAFPYVNGGLFADENIIIPRFNDEIIELLLERASEDFDWSAISPTIFGAVFESTLNPETRRSGGMHYTSVENIHKVIDPLFYEALAAELDEISAITVKKTRDIKLEEYQHKLASLKFLDPACGSGNFLTETYLSLRRLENRAISLRLGDQIVLGDAVNPIRVSIGQFYGIEINDFAVTVARTALWIAESQMMKETEEIVHMNLDFLPLTSYANIVEANALRIDWEDVVPKNELNYIMGNPPFVGYTLQTKEQKADLQAISPVSAKNIDYVSGWFFKSADMIQETNVRVALVSTNSITQGEQVAVIWKPLFTEKGIHIDFAHRTFQWDSESNLKAHVHCVVVGFSVVKSNFDKLIFSSGRSYVAKNINAYLFDAPDVYIEDRKKPLCNGVTIMNKGSQGTDDGNFYFDVEEYNLLTEKYANISSLIREATNGQTFISGKKRYCLWCEGINPAELRKYPELMQRIKAVQMFRKNSPKEATRRWADMPYLFTENRQPSSGNYLLLPLTSSERRRYVPIGYLPYTVIANNSVQMVPNATLFDFGILTSNVFMSWMRAVGGRLKSDYRITVTNVYNNFPWPNPTEAQKSKIEQTAQAILDARELYPDSSLADLYDEVTMPPELRRAHQQNDKAVMQAYGFWGKINTEPECVAELMKMYKELTVKLKCYEKSI